LISSKRDEVSYAIKIHQHKLNELINAITRRSVTASHRQ
jgi:hypothetical protein